MSNNRTNCVEVHVEQWDKSMKFVVGGRIVSKFVAPLFHYNTLDICRTSIHRSTPFDKLRHEYPETNKDLISDYAILLNGDID